MGEVSSSVVERYELPGSAVFPESVGLDPATGDAYVGSLGDGALYRLTRGGDVELWSPAGTDARKSVAGVKVDPFGRLWAAGGYEGSLYVYDLPSRSLLARMDVGGRPSCVNDIAFGPAGEAYVTDSFISLLFRVDSNDFVLRPWVNLRESGVPWAEGLNFNGIALTSDGEHMIVCQTNLGRFWQVTIETGEVDEVALQGGPLEHCDGIALSGSTLYVAVNAYDRVALVELSGDGSAGTVTALVRSDDFAFPTSVAIRDGQLLVVNSQLDKMGTTPVIPFTVAAHELPNT
jgi:superoxide dismutase, Cu-Zn family